MGGVRKTRGKWLYNQECEKYRIQFTFVMLSVYFTCLWIHTNESYNTFSKFANTCIWFLWITSYFIFVTIFSLLFRIKNVSLILYSESPMLWHTWKVILLNSEKGLYFKSLYIYSVKWIKLIWCVNLAEIILYNENKDI